MRWFELTVRADCEVSLRVLAGSRRAARRVARQARETMLKGFDELCSQSEAYAGTEGATAGIRPADGPWCAPEG
jgi:hypothetical protein